MNRLITLHELRHTPEDVINRARELRDVEASANLARNESLALRAAVKAEQERLAIEKVAHETVKREYEVRLAAIERREAAVTAAESALSARLASVILRETSVDSAEHRLADKLAKLPFKMQFVK